MMAEMMEQMQKGFDRMNQRLDSIETKIDRLSHYVKVMHRDLMRSLEFISKQVFEIADELQVSQAMQNHDIYQYYNLLQPFIENQKHIERKAPGIKYFMQWHEVDVNVARDALNALNTFISSPVNLHSVARNDFSITDLSQPKPIANIAFEQTVKATEFYYDYLPNKRDLVNSLLLSVNRITVDINIRQKELRSDINCVPFEDVITHYFNPYFLTNVSEKYLAVQPFFILQDKADPNFAPIENLTVLVEDDFQSTIRCRLNASIGRINNLMHIVNCSIAQQTLLSGQLILPQLDNALFGTQGGLQLAINALKANTTLSQNLVTYILLTRCEQAKLLDLLDLIKRAKAAKIDLKPLNAHLLYTGEKATFSYNSSTNEDANLYLTFKQGSHEVKMLVPEPEILASNELVYSTDLYRLLMVKERLINTMIDVGFTSTLTTDESDVFKMIFFN
jgi:hypothetical protein